MIEILESRRLFAGVTLLTHGFQLSGGLPNWLATMESALSTKMHGANIYRMTINNSGGLHVASFTKVASGATNNAESIVTVDWSAVANVIFFPSVGADDIAALVAPYFKTAQNLAGDPGTAHPFAELPIQLAGHSRGGSLVADLARKLADSGIWVDHLTLWDPYPVSGDPAVSVADNVVFSDDYFQNNNSPSGSAVAGSHSRNLTGVSGVVHTTIHSWYHGTIARTATTDGDGISIQANWYSDGRALEGYDKSHIGAGTRWADGISSLDGGVATRSHISVTDPTPWDDVGSLSLSGGSGGIVANGDAFNINYRYQDIGGGSSVNLYLDSDTNPYNGFARTLGTQSSLAATGTTPNTLAGSLAGSWSNGGLSRGAYYLAAGITSQHTRYSYMTQPIYVTSAGATVMTKQWSDETTNHNWSDASNWIGGGTPTSSDNVLIGAGSSNLAASQTIHSLVLHDGANLSVTTNGNRVLSTSQLLLGTSAKLDLNDNDMIIDYTGASPMVAVEALISSASNGGAWTGFGITSTAARNANPAITTLGVIEASDYKSVYGNAAPFDGQTVDTSSLLIKYTYYGDTDFSGQVDFDDYVHADTGYNSSLSGWFNGDFDLNGSVDFDDYVSMDAAFNAQSSIL